MLGMLLAGGIAGAQKAPPTSARPWDVPSGQQQLTLPSRPVAFVPDSSKTYTLPDLVNIAEQNNPDTRVAWENAKARAADLGIAKSTLYPTLAAAAVGSTARINILFNTEFVRQTTYNYAHALALDYIIFDFGRRSDEITVSKYNLIAANFQFNDTHRTVIFGVMQAYYRLLNARGQQDAAEANLKNAQTVRENSEARLSLGLATLPDVLEARSAEAQADYDLQATIGVTQIAYGDLTTALGLSPTTKIQVQGIQDLKIPDEITNTVEKSIDLALAQRPDLMQRVAQLRAASAELKEAHSAYLPTLSVDGNAGLDRILRSAVPYPRRLFPDAGVLERETQPHLDHLRRLGARAARQKGQRRKEAGSSRDRRHPRPGGERRVVSLRDGTDSASPAKSGSRAVGLGDRVL